MKIIVKLCQKLSKILPGLTIRVTNPKTGIKEDYLSRYYFFLKDRNLCNIFLHNFHSSDLDVGEGGYGLFHCHPWKYSISFIFSGGYWEERLQKDGSIKKHWIKPLSFNFITNKDFHRVDLAGDDVWTIFFTTGRSKKLSWGFYDRVSKQYRDWQTSPNAIP